MEIKDLIAGFIIGEISALILLGILKLLGVSPQLPNLLLKWANFTPLIFPALSVLGVGMISVFAKRVPILFQWGKSFLVGILNTFIDLGFLNLLMYLAGISSGLFYTVFKGSSFILATINSYFWNKFWTFRKKGMEKAGQEFASFLTIAGVGLLIHLSVASFLVNMIGPQFGFSPTLWANFSAMIAVLVGFSWNFLGYKFLVFKK